MSQQHFLFGVLVNIREFQRKLNISAGQLFQQASLAGHMEEYLLLFMLKTATSSRVKGRCSITALTLCKVHTELARGASSGMAGVGVGELQFL